MQGDLPCSDVNLPASFNSDKVTYNLFLAQQDCFRELIWFLNWRILRFQKFFILVVIATMIIIIQCKLEGSEQTDIGQSRIPPLCCGCHGSQLRQHSSTFPTDPPRPCILFLLVFLDAPFPSSNSPPAHPLAWSPPRDWLHPPAEPRTEHSGTPSVRYQTCKP